MPEYKGQNACVFYDGDEITIVREGRAAKLNFVDPHPWQIPVPALTGVDLRPPSALHVGRLQFLVKGASVHYGSTSELHEDPAIGLSASRLDCRTGRAATCAGGSFDCAQKGSQVNRGPHSRRARRLLRSSRGASGRQDG